MFNKYNNVQLICQTKKGAIIDCSFDQSFLE